MRVLLAEDDRASALLLQKYLQAKGYEVLHAADGSQALTRVLADAPDIVLLDVEMPERDGWEVLQEVRSISDVPVIMVTVRNATADKVRGLVAGADDYVTKPFDLKEIEARIAAVLRRYGATDEVEAGAKLNVGRLVIDDRAKEVRVGRTRLSLSPKEYQLLYLLCTEPGRVFGPEEILAAVWPERSDANGEDVKKYVYFLRQKLLRAGPGAPKIGTARGFGYKIEPPG